ncbi:MAG: cysteine desulfurase-like protein [Gemmataceae bacterium]|nr:cysteine desulfurase-like protein [Gemmataceae bacterium]
MFEVASLRRQFPALQQSHDGRTPIFLDGPAGTQAPQQVIDAMVRYLTRCNANHGGVFRTSVESDAILDDAHQAVADFLHAPYAEEIIFGGNMTTLTFHLSRSIAKRLQPGDEVMVTRLDHDANVSPWMLAARDAGATVRWIDVNPEDGTLDFDSFRRQLNSKTRLVAVGLASNVLGTINDVTTIAREAKAVGAWTFVDAVHFAPHGPIDVQAIGCDFLACSAYKFFGPHVGILWGRRALLEGLPAYKVRPSPKELPGRWMTGTQNHEGIAGTAAAVEYLAEIGRACPEYRDPFSRMHGRALDVHAGMAGIQEYERGIGGRLLQGLAERPRFRIWGIRDVSRLAERVPTISITDCSLTPRQLAERLAAREIYAWNGNNYALEISERLGLEPHGGFVRLGLVHTNTADEVDRLLQTLDEIVAD